MSRIGRASSGLTAGALIALLSGCQNQMQVAGSSVDRPIIVPPDQSVSLGSVYWVSGCTSLLNRVTDVSTFEGANDLELTLKRDVMVTPTQCPNAQVPGAMVYARAKHPVQTPSKVAVRYTVSYDTREGTQQSSHTRYVVIEPGTVKP